MRFTRRTFPALLLLTLHAVAPVARADFGPKLMAYVRVDVRRDVGPLPDEATTALLSPAPQAGDGPANAAARVPELAIPWTDDSGQDWNYAGYLWGGEIENGTATFYGFMDYMFRETAPQGLPSIVRLAVYDPQTGRLYVTAPASPGQHLALLRADLTADGTGSLRSIPVPFWQWLDFWKALLITLIVECYIVVWVARSRSNIEKDADRAAVRRRGRWGLIRVCVLANLLTLPLVWLFGGEALFRYGFWLGTLAFLGLEVVAFAIEAASYRGILSLVAGSAQMSWPTAIRASLNANVATFLLGFVL